ncbi:MAG: transposon-encoded TnpW family protein [Lachnospiraceae bacterium]|nr:transposon-encoded TnpW family protein [Lachnospiraceae bacterium]
MMPETKPAEGGLIMKSGKTTFLIGLHFSETSKDTLEDKVKKLIRKDVEEDNF